MNLIRTNLYPNTSISFSVIVSLIYAHGSAEAQARFSSVEDRRSKSTPNQTFTMDVETEEETSSIPLPTPKSFPAEGKPLGK